MMMMMRRDGFSPALQMHRFVHGCCHHTHNLEQGPLHLHRDDVEFSLVYPAAVMLCKCIWPLLSLSFKA